MRLLTETFSFKEVCILPELFLGISVIYLVLHSVFLASHRAYPLIQRSVVYLSVLVLGLSCFLLVNDPLCVSGINVLNNTIAADYVSFSAKLTTGILSLLCLLVMQQYLKDQKINQFEYSLLILFSVLGLFLVCCANDLITAYLAIELQSLSFYVLAAFKKDSTFSIDAGIKYFILGAFASCFFLFGSSLLYGISGTVNFDEFKDLFFSESNCKITKLVQDASCADTIANMYYYNYLSANLKFDALAFLSSDLSFSSVGLNLSYLENISFSSNIDKLAVLNLIYQKLDTILFDIIFCVYNYDVGLLLFELYEFNSLISYSTECHSNPLFFLTVCDIVENYIKSVSFDSSPSNIEFVNFALMFILISLFFKLAIAPFHVWAPDVYENSPTISTFFFSVVPKLAIFILMLRIFYFSFYGFIENWRYFILTVTIFTVIIGSFGGIEQRKLKSLLVYSSISHMGYSLLAFSSGTFESVQALFCYLIVYSFSGFCIWAIFLLLRLKNNHANKRNKDLSDIILLGKTNPILAIFFTLILFSVAGFPPLVGFLVKINIFLSAMDSTMYFVALISILCSVIATFYYLRVIKSIYFEKKLVGQLYYPISTENAVFITMLLFFIIFLFINPTLLFLFSYKFSLLAFL